MDRLYTELKSRLIRISHTIVSFLSILAPFWYGEISIFFKPIVCSIIQTATSLLWHPTLTICFSCNQGWEEIICLFVKITGTFGMDGWFLISRLDWFGKHVEHDEWCERESGSWEKYMYHERGSYTERKGWVRDRYAHATAICEDLLRNNIPFY